MGCPHVGQYLRAAADLFAAAISLCLLPKYNFEDTKVKPAKKIRKNAVFPSMLSSAVFRVKQHCPDRAKNPDKKSGSEIRLKYVDLEEVYDDQQHNRDF